MDQHGKDIGEFLEGVDWDKVSELLKSSPEDKSPKVETIDFLMENLNVDKENVKSPNTFYETTFIQP